ncbi:hypothetical protein [Streptococcus equi]|uniref:hypothetical protein n=1 Tax=Streptococcus equi TaxID=1336 RepID=UPI001E58CDC1|nr:hypothetical protein [Streptococcus equi]
MNHDGIATILATGGNAMVKAAYSCGKPALGVGAGNVPAYVEKSANIRQAAHVLSCLNHLTMVWFVLLSRLYYRQGDL